MKYRSSRKARQELREIASTQGGYVTSQQAHRVGYDRRHLVYHVSAGNLERVGWGLYRIPGLALADHDDLIRWTLWSRNREGTPQATVGHESALAVHDLGDVLPSAVHLVVPPGFRKVEPRGCRLHRAEVGGRDIQDHEGYRVTTPTRTLLDVAGRSDFSTRTLRRAVRDAIDRGEVRSSELRSRAIELGLDARLGLASGGKRKKP